LRPSGGALVAPRLSSSGTSKEEIDLAIAIDPVCGMEVETDLTDLTLEHEGTTYWFCGKGCLLEFRDEPAKYLDPNYKPSM
jgi:Cu+-exporting ATPase